MCRYPRSCKRAGFDFLLRFPKIRQELQILRDLGLLTFLGQGSYSLR